MKRRHLLGSLVAILSPQARALYDPEPMALLRHLPGRWHGSLTYRDWSPPHGLVSLPCDLFAALNSPSQASLYFVFQDGPAKVVHSYDRWTVGDAGEVFAYTDWAYRSKINYFLYSAAEFRGRSSLEGGLKVGYKSNHGYEIAAFARKTFGPR